MRDRKAILSLILVTLWMLGNAGVEAQAQELSTEDLAANQELDRRFVEAYNQRNSEAFMEAFWKSPNLLVVLYDGTVYRGWEELREATEKFLAGLESAHVEIVEITHVPVGDAVLAVGTATYQLQPKEGPLQRFTGRWSDVRRKVEGRWVYVHDHARPACCAPCTEGGT